MSEQFIRFRSMNGRIYECFPDERGRKALTPTEARQLLNRFCSLEAEKAALKARVAELEALLSCHPSNNG